MIVIILIEILNKENVSHKPTFFYNSNPFSIKTTAARVKISDQKQQLFQSEISLLQAGK